MKSKNKFMSAVGVIMLTIQTGLTRVCGPRSGGNIELYVVDAADVTSMTLTGTSWSSITMNGSAVFKKFEFEQDTCGRKEDATTENGSTKIEHIIEAYFGNQTQTNRDRMQDILDSASCGIICITKDANGRKWVTGYSANFLKERPMRMPTIAGDSGKAFTDQTGYMLTLKSTDNQMDREFTGTIPV